ncbi:MAG: SprT family zinc-dependent metalloprotease [Gammaproteobacteria bacterium]|nr:SprT family zinc-dependent metalloprotease [Gammaproteobacteria bacterium]
MPLPALNKQLLLARVEQCYRLAEAALDKKLVKPTVLFNQRGRIAGSALLQRHTLRFHPKIYLQNQQHYLTHVVAHEVAHLIVWQCYGRVAPHGKEWQTIMTAVFKLPAERTHSYDTDNLGIKTFDYQCGCQIIKLSTRRHNNALKGTKYICRGCRNQLIAV